MTKRLLVLAFAAACGGKSTPQTTTAPATTKSAMPTTNAGPTTFASVAALDAAIAADPQHLTGATVELAAEYLNAAMQNKSGEVYYNVTLVDGKDSATKGFVCRSKDKVTVDVFGAITAHGTLRDGALADCTISPR